MKTIVVKTKRKTTKTTNPSVRSITRFRPMILSRHPSHRCFRPGRVRQLSLMPFRSVIRFGSTTVPEDGLTRIELNTPQAVRNSSNKLLMKQAFQREGVKTADWWTSRNNMTRLQFERSGEITREAVTEIQNLPYPIVAKHHFGSRGTGNTLLQNQQELEVWMRGKTLSNYIFEKYYNYDKEYRVHVSELGCFYSCRKMLRRDTPEANRWYKNDSNSVWILERNPEFDRPTNWRDIEEHSRRALRAVGLQFGACDIRVQKNVDSRGRNRETIDFIIVEINSAPGLAEVGQEIYQQHLEQLLRYKYANR